MSGLATDFDRLGLAQYADRFVEHGFDNWETLESLTEEDFVFLEVKLGHRRTIQKGNRPRSGS